MQKLARLILFAFSFATISLTYQNCAQNNYGIQTQDLSSALKGDPATSQNENSPPAQNEVIDIATQLPDPEPSSDPIVTTMPVPDPMGNVVIPRPSGNESSTTMGSNTASSSSSSSSTVNSTTNSSESMSDNSSSLPPPPAAEPPKVVCDPFSSTQTNTKPGIKAELFYLPPGAEPPNSVFKYFDIGTKLNADLYFSQVNTPTRNFIKGFPTSEGELLQDGNGNALLEYFALKLQSNIKLSDKDQEGYYQFALLADDGATLDLSIDGQNLRIVDNDGTHSTKMGCASKTVKMSKGMKIPMTLSYYQGPRVRIALMLKWRFIAKTDAQLQNIMNSKSLNDGECGKEGDNHFFNSDDPTSPETKASVGLTSRGWKTLAPENFELSESMTTVTCQPK